MEITGSLYDPATERLCQYNPEIVAPCSKAIYRTYLDWLFLVLLLVVKYLHIIPHKPEDPIEFQNSHCY